MAVRGDQWTDENNAVRTYNANYDYTDVPNKRTKTKKQKKPRALKVLNTVTNNS